MSIESKGEKPSTSSATSREASNPTYPPFNQNSITLRQKFVVRCAISGSLVGLLLPLPSILFISGERQNPAFFVFVVLYSLFFLFLLAGNFWAWLPGYTKRFEAFLNQIRPLRAHAWVLVFIAIITFSLIFSMTFWGKGAFGDSLLGLKEGMYLASFFFATAVVSLAPGDSWIAQLFFKWIGDERPSTAIILKITPALLLLFTFGALLQMNLVNTDPTTHDQDAYIQFSQRLEASQYTYLSDGNRTPLYPLIQSLFIDPTMSREEAFTRGKISSLGLAMILIAALYFILRRSIPTFAVSLTLITAFSLFMFRAPYFQGELLYYFLFFCTFLMMAKMLLQPSWQLAGLTGLAAGLAYLAKPSVSPALLAFVVFSIFKVIFQHFRQRPQPGVGKSLRQLAQTGLVVVVFTILLIPYMAFNQKVYGQLTYNVNSNFYLWYDSWSEAEKGTRAHGDRVGWPDMPENELPSMQRYLREHSIVDIASRLVIGSAKTIGLHCLDAYGYCKYELIYTLAALSLILANKKQFYQTIVANLPLVLFAIAIGIGYILSFGWWAPIGLGRRFMLVLFLPFMLSLAFIIGNKISDQQLISIGDHRLPFPQFVSRISLLVLIIDIPFLIFTASYLYSGS